MGNPDEEYIRQLTDAQNALFGYLVTLLGNPGDAREVLQETNVVLWRKMGDFEPGTNFKAWARKVAYFQALAFLRDRKRDPHVFDEDLLAMLAEEEPESTDETATLLALRDCLARLPDAQRELMDLRYRAELPVAELASRFRKKQSAMKMALMRTRQALLECIEVKLAEGAP